MTAIIGADGKMGVWLRDHLTKLGHTIVSYDDRKGDNLSVLREVDMVIVSVPVSKTAEVIRNVLRHMRKGAMIVEIASLKNGIHREMVEAAENGFNALSVHPLFGPSVKALRDKTVAVIPVVDPIMESSWATELFPGASFVEVDPEKHDRLMVHVLSLHAKRNQQKDSRCNFLIEPNHFILRALFLCGGLNGNSDVVVLCRTPDAVNYFQGAQ